MLDDALDRVALHILDDSELGVGAELDGEQCVGVAQGQRRLTHRQLHIHRLVATCVDGRRDLLGNAHAAGRALAKLGAQFAFENNAIVSHVAFLLVST